MESTLDAPLPRNSEAERGVLGAILLDNCALKTAVGKLKAEDFFHEQHQQIYRHMITLAETQQVIDLITLPEQLNRAGELESVGGAAYVAELIDGVPHVWNIDFYADIIKNKALLRQLIHASNTIMRDALAAEAEPDILLAKARAAFEGISSGLKSTVEVYTAAEIMKLGSEATEYIVFPFAARGMVALLDGVPKLSGKTTMILTAVAASLKDRLFLNQASRTVPILLVTEENPRTLRLELNRAGLTDATNLHIIPFKSFAGLAWPQLAQRIDQVCRDLNIGWLILDTFYSVVGLGGDEENRAGAVDEAIAPLRRLAGKLDIAITLLRHERKAGGEVGTSGRGSSALTGAVDIVTLLKRSFGKASTHRQLEVTGRVEQVTLHVELRDQAYVVVDLPEQTEDEVHRLDHAISAHPMASARELEKLTGIGRNRIESVAAKSGWKRSDSGWSRAGT